eukprot:15461300-Alexandrium_andersonii.AAC.1
MAGALLQRPAVDGRGGKSSGFPTARGQSCKWRFCRMNNCAEGLQGASAEKAGGRFQPPRSDCMLTSLPQPLQGQRDARSVSGGRAAQRALTSECYGTVVTPRHPWRAGAWRAPPTRLAGTAASQKRRTPRRWPASPLAHPRTSSRR